MQPAKAFVTYTIGYNGVFACTNRMAFLKEDAHLRTDESFKYRTNPKHHNRQDKTPFEVYIFINGVSISIGLHASRMSRNH